METTALSDLWRDIETTEPNDRRKLAKELGLPDLQARVLVQDRQLSQAIEGDDWLLITTRVVSHAPTKGSRWL